MPTDPCCVACNVAFSVCDNILEETKWGKKARVKGRNGFKKKSKGHKNKTWPRSRDLAGFVQHVCIPHDCTPNDPFSVCVSEQVFESVHHLCCLKLSSSLLLFVAHA